MRFENKFVGLTVKQVLEGELGFSRRAITSLKKRPDGILINGSHATVRALICEGDVLEINFEDAEIHMGADAFADAPMPEILFENDELLAVSKPAHMPTHQSAGHYGDTLASSVLRYYSELGRPFVFRAINRLDRNTSGVVLIAKDRIACSRYASLMRDGGIRKVYLAILDGILSEDEGVIDAPIRRAGDSVILREVCGNDGGGQRAITEYRVIARSGGLTLVAASPITGRTHQLRVHFAHLGAPILGDELYGKGSMLIGRHALHACSIDIESEGLHIFAPLPQDMAEVIGNVFGEGFLNYGE